MKHSVGISISEKQISLVLINDRGSAVKKEAAALFHTDPELIWQSVLHCLGGLLSGLPGRAEILSCGAASPPDWFIAADSEGIPIYNFPPGSDEDLKEEARLISEKADSLTAKTGVRFDSSSPLAKILRFKKEHHEIYRKTRKFIPLAGFITGKLSGEYFTAAPSFGDGLGFDSVSFRWHRFIKELGVLPETLPVIKDHGEGAGKVLSPEAVSAGLPRGVRVSVPAADDFCVFISSGAAEPGQWHSDFGGRIGLNTIAENIISSPLARIRYRCFEQGSWTAGAVIYAGEDSLPEKFLGENYGGLMNGMKESGLIVCPPPGESGGSLPFIQGEDGGFIIGKPRDDADLFSGYMEGIAYLEKWTFELLEELGFKTGREVFATGRAGDGLLSLRAAVTEKRFRRPAEPGPEFGMALLGLVKIVYENIPEAMRDAVKFSGSFDPPREGDYRSKYRKFRRACKAIGYV